MIAPSPSSPRPAALTWSQCRGCGLMQPLPAPVKGHRRVCSRCRTSFGTGIADPQAAFAMAATALLLFLLAQFFPLMGIEMEGITNTVHISSGVVGFVQHDYSSLGMIILCVAIAAPLWRILAMTYVTAGLHMRNRLPYLKEAYKISERLRSWAMLDVFLLGALVALTKLHDLAQINIGIGFWGLGLVVLALVALDLSFDRRAIWDALVAPPVMEGTPDTSIWSSCHTCEMVQKTGPQEHPAKCMRCGAAMHHRKPDSLNRTWALVIAGLILYIPANLYPVMTIISFGRGTPSTIMEGVRELLTGNDWPLALIVFTASIVFPLLKLFSLIWLMLSIHWRSQRRPRARTRLYHIIEYVGRWSNIDVFVAALLTALVTLGNIATVEPGNGVLAFGAVVVITMLATESFDPRLIWDAAEKNHAR